VLATLSAHAADGDIPRLEAYGDPLPAEAQLRFGTLRFRADPPPEECVLSPDGNQEAKQLLEELAKGHADAPLTEEAKRTLKRLVGR
jgi:hypothetical protein